MAHNEHEIRQVAENLLQTSGQQYVQTPTTDISHSYSINTIQSLHPDYVVSEDLLAGQRFAGRMSNVRRFFCLFVTFDLTFTGLMWIICIMLKGENIVNAMNEQILHYNIHTSLFDVVVIALCRFIFLIVFYAIVYMNHWIVIALSTAMTCAFLVAKVFCYNWTQTSQPVFEVLLVITSFILSWGEAWFLDFRVLPQESQSRRYLITNQDPERAPLIQSYMRGLPSQYTESVANFYSPRSTPDGSMYRYPTAQVFGKYPPVRLTSQQEETYKSLAARTFQEAWDLLHCDNWKQSKSLGDDTVFTMPLSGGGKIFKLTATVDVHAKFLLDELFYGVENIPKWNPALLESHKVQVIDEHTDITYQISGDAGMVTSRDFVTLRKWNMIEGHYVIACVATEHPSLPDNKKYVRGLNGIGCWAMQTDPLNPNRCFFQWILNTNLKGWIPQSIVDLAIVDMMLSYIKHLRIHVRENGRLHD